MSVQSVSPKISSPPVSPVQIEKIDLAIKILSAKERAQKPQRGELVGMQVAHHPGCLGARWCFSVTQETDDECCVFKGQWQKNPKATHVVATLMKKESGKTLRDFINHFSQTQELWEQFQSSPYPKKWAIQLLDTLIYMQSQGICHRDLKIENIIIDSLKDLKVIDFGFSREMGGIRRSRSFCGTPSSVAPEVIKLKEYDPMKSDVWSFGVVLCQMWTGTVPAHLSKLPIPQASDKKAYQRQVCQFSSAAEKEMEHSHKSYLELFETKDKCGALLDPMKAQVLNGTLRPTSMKRMSLEEVKGLPYFSTREALVSTSPVGLLTEDPIDRYAQHAPISQMIFDNAYLELKGASRDADSILQILGIDIFRDLLEHSLCVSIESLVPLGQGSQGQVFAVSQSISVEQQCFNIHIPYKELSEDEERLGEDETYSTESLRVATAADACDSQGRGSSLPSFRGSSLPSFNEEAFGDDSQLFNSSLPPSAEGGEIGDKGVVHTLSTSSLSLNGPQLKKPRK